MKFDTKQQGEAYCRLINTARLLINEFEDNKKFKETPEMFMYKLWQFTVIEDLKRAVKTLEKYDLKG